MRDERLRRRPDFLPGLDLRLADGQVWSVPAPEAGVGVDPAGDDRGLASRPGPPVAWRGPDYHAILRALGEADDPGSFFRAELALLVHLLRFNYEVDGADLDELLDDRDDARAARHLRESLDRLAAAHLGRADASGVAQPSGSAVPAIRLGHRLARLVGWGPRAGWGRGYGGSADGTA